MNFKTTLFCAAAAMLVVGEAVFAEDPYRVRDVQASWCAVGTSITWYNEHVKASGGRFTRGYQSRVMDVMKFSGYTNIAINGGTIVNHLRGGWKYPKCDVYTIEHGINDWGHSATIGKLEDYVNGGTYASFYGRYRLLISDKIRAANPKAKIVLCTPRKAYGFRGYLPDHSYEPKKGIYLKEYAEAVRAIAAYEGFEVADFFNECGEDEELESLSIDKALHPNDAGYARMAKTLIPALTRAIDGAKPNQRAVVWEKRRQETLEWFAENFYGRAPVGRPKDIEFDMNQISFAGGRIVMHLQVKLPEGASKENPAPVFVFGDHAKLSRGEFYPDVPEDEIVARGYAFVRYDFNEIAPDRNATDPKRIDGVFKEYGGWDKPDGWGRVAAWAWGFSRVMDWIETRPDLDRTRVAVVGHSRGGKTALWAAACDTRIAMAVANGSGTGGAHLNASVTPGSEQVAIFKNVGSWNFFCQNFLKLEGCETNLQHDADDLLRLIVPRLAYVASAANDTGAGPEGEFEAARRASDLWEAYGQRRMSFKSYPPPERVDHVGGVGYHVRNGKHQLKATDWRRFLDFADRHGWCRKKESEIEK